MGLHFVRAYCEECKFKKKVLKATIYLGWSFPKITIDRVYQATTSRIRNRQLMSGNRNRRISPSKVYYPVSTVTWNSWHPYTNMYDTHPWLHHLPFYFKIRFCNILRVNSSSEEFICLKFSCIIQIYVRYIILQWFDRDTGGNRPVKFTALRRDLWHLRTRKRTIRVR